MSKLRFLSFGSVIFVATCAALNAATYNVRDFGATGDGTTKDTKAFQKALDTCAVNGGGDVLVPAGKYLIGSIQIGNRTILRLEKDTVLAGSADIEDYPLIDIRWEGRWQPGHRGLIYATAVDHIGIIGPGRIEGSVGPPPPAPAPSTPSTPPVPVPAPAPPPATYPATYPYPYQPYAYPPPLPYGYYYPAPLRPPLPKPRFPDDAAVATSPFLDAIVAGVSWQNRVTQPLNVGAEAGVYLGGRLRVVARAAVPASGQTDQPGIDSSFDSAGY